MLEFAPKIERQVDISSDFTVANAGESVVVLGVAMTLTAGSHVIRAKDSDGNVLFSFFMSSILQIKEATMNIPFIADNGLTFAADADTAGDGSSVSVTVFLSQVGA